MNSASSTLRTSSSSTSTFRFSLLALAVGFSLSAHAETTPDTANQLPDGVEHIVVTGEKVSRGIEDTVTSVDVIGQQTIEDSVHQDVGEILQRIANVDAFDVEDAGFTIRGVRNDGTTNATGGDLASVYLDGAVLSSRQVSAGLLELFDISQVEVFRGPQSTIQGRNALAGAIVVQSAKPVFESEGHIQLRYAEDNTYQAAGAYSNSIIDDVLAFRVSFNKKASDNDITNTHLNIDDWAKDDSEIFKLRLLWQPMGDEDLALLYTFTNADVRKGNRTLADSDNPFSRNVEVDHPNHDLYDTDMHILDVSATLNDQWSFTSVTSYSDTNETDFQERDMTTQSLAYRERRVDEETFTQEFRFNYNNQEGLNVLFGAYYFDNSRASYGDPAINIDTIDLEPFRPTINGILQQLGAQPLPDALPLPGLQAFVNRDGFEDIENTAFFVSADWQFATNWMLNVGLRYDREELTAGRVSERSRKSDFTQNPALPGALGVLLNQVADGALAQQANDTGSDSITYDAWLPKVALNYYWSENTTTGFSVSRGYRSGGFIENQFLQKNVEYDPEYTTNYELSFRTVTFDEQLSIQANIFYVDWKDMQVSGVSHSNNVGDEDTQNAAKAEFYGAEFQAQYAPNSIEGLQLYMTFGTNHTEFKEFSSEFDGLNLDLTDNEFPNAPEFTWSSGFSMRDDSGWYYGAEFNYRGESFTNVPNTPVNASAGTVFDPNRPSITESHFLVNARVGYETDNWDVYLYAKNLLDEEYFTRSPQNRAIASTVYPFNIGRPRSVGVQVNYRF